MCATAQFSRVVICADAGADEESPAAVAAPASTSVTEEPDTPTQPSESPRSSAPETSSHLSTANSNADAATPDEDSLSMKAPPVAQATSHEQALQYPSQPTVDASATSKIGEGPQLQGAVLTEAGQVALEVAQLSEEGTAVRPSDQDQPAESAVTNHQSAGELMSNHQFPSGYTALFLK